MKNKTEILNGLTRAFHRTGLQLKKHGPEILVGVGVVGTVVSTVMACKATTKLPLILDEAKEKVEEIHDAVEECKTAGTIDYPEESAKRDLTVVYAQTGLKLAKLYGPAVAVGVASITCILSGHSILHKRNAGLAVAYAALDNTFKDYRGRVIERFGKELDRELRYNIKSEEIEEVTVNEDGSETVTTKTVEVVDPNEISEYAFFFDETCNGWERNAEYNLLFLRKQQDYANDLLKSRGHVFLNEVLDMLGMQRCKRGQIVGWVYDPKNPNGDNFIDFGIYDISKKKNREFVNGIEKSILLDFNVDGPIFDLI